MSDNIIIRTPISDTFFNPQVMMMIPFLLLQSLTFVLPCTAHTADRSAHLQSNKSETLNTASKRRRNGSEKKILTTHLFKLGGIKLLPPPRVTFNLLGIKLPLCEEPDLPMRQSVTRQSVAFQLTLFCPLLLGGYPW
jgi:hypothetical protein